MSSDLVLPNDLDTKGVMVVSATTDRPAIADKFQFPKMDPKVLEAEKVRLGALNAPAKHERATMAALDGLDSGEMVIDLYETLRRHRTYTGNSEYPIPLAVARPRDRTVWVDVWPQSNIVDYYARYPRSIFGKTISRPVYSVRFDDQVVRGKRYQSSHAAVPDLPSEIAERFPAVKSRKGKFLLLWEASWAAWDEHFPRPPRPRDPALLEHVTGSLFKVRAVWDLTLVELAALQPAPRF